MKKSLSLTIGQLAKSSDVGIETIRFYEREGILAKPQRRESGYREYPPETALRIRFIKRAQALGFSLKEISQLLAIQVDPKADCSAVKKRAEKKVEEIGQKIEDLKRMQTVLNRVTKACVSSKPIGECPILQCFEDQD